MMRSATARMLRVDAAVSDPEKLRGRNGGDRPPGIGRAGQPRFAKPGAQCRVHAHPPCRVGDRLRLTCHEVDARNRRLLHANRNRADPEKSACRSGSIAAVGFRFPVPRLGRSGSRPVPSLAGTGSKWSGLDQAGTCLFVSRGAISRQWQSPLNRRPTESPARLRTSIVSAKSSVPMLQPLSQTETSSLARSAPTIIPITSLCDSVRQDRPLPG